MSSQCSPTSLAAEGICATYGLHLLAPRSPEHLAAVFDVAVAETLTPVGGGDVAAGAD